MKPTSIKVALAQIEVKPGRPRDNLRSVLHYINMAREQRADIVVFPELCIPGYLLGDLWEQRSFINECLNCNDLIREASQGLAVVYGNVGVDENRCGEDGRIRKYNALYVMENGHCRNSGAYASTGLNFISKTLMPNYREFDDSRHFYDYRKLSLEMGIPIDCLFQPVVLSNGLKMGCMLCEDGWDTDYSISPIRTMYEMESDNRPDLIINASCSPYTSGKDDKRNRVFSAHAQEGNIPIVYVNNVGIQNNGKTVYTFDGRSCTYDAEGNQLRPFSPFEEGCMVVELGLEGKSQRHHEYDDQDGIVSTYNAIRYGTEKFIELLSIDHIVIGASGGIDSSVVAAIIYNVVGRDRITLVNMPTKFNSQLTQSLAFLLSQNIRCQYWSIEITDSVDLTQCQFDGKLTPFMLENVQARDRSSRVLAAMASLKGGAFTCNANKSEMTVGYSTFYGDLAGFMCPIGDLWKTQVYELARFFNAHIENIIPEECLRIKPSAELSDNQDITKNLGDPFIYSYHDKLFSSWVERWNRATPEDILRWYDNNRLEKEIGFDGNVRHLFASDGEFITDLEKWWNCYQGLAVAKRIQSPPVLAVSRRAFGFDHRESQIGPTYTDAYYRLKNTIIGE